MRCYQEKDGLKYLLERLVIDGKEEQFPLALDQSNLMRDFKKFEDDLYEKIHPKIESGAAVKGDGRLTFHDARHIDRVFYCARKLLSGKESEMSGYEIYLLCIAIHLHDIGNIDGRVGHEKRIKEILKRFSIDIPIGNDSVTNETVINIAQAHGGTSEIHKDRDTFFDLPNEIPLFGDFKVRPTIIASILRFADEVSDLYKRTDDSIETPTGNEIHHIYSNALQECQLDGRAIRLKYRLKYEDTQKQIRRGLYLYDEIRNRLAKLMREMEYCSKYSEGMIRVCEVHVAVVVTEKDNESAIEYKDGFTLCLRGYPDDKANGFDYYLDYDKDTKKPSEPKCRSGKELKNAINAIKGGRSK